MDTSQLVLEPAQLVEPGEHVNGLQGVEAVEQELFVEEISIDGMCGVY